MINVGVVVLAGLLIIAMWIFFTANDDDI